MFIDRAVSLIVMLCSTENDGYNQSGGKCRFERVEQFYRNPNPETSIECVVFENRPEFISIERIL